MIDLKDRVQVAYKKLKQMVYFETNTLKLRQRLAEFECADDFDGRLRTVEKVAKLATPHESKEFIRWLGEIAFEIIPKSIQGPPTQSPSEGSFLTNVTSAFEYNVLKVNYLFDGPIELHLLSVLWLMMEGPEYERTMTSHCMGARLHPLVGNDNDHSAHLFRKYHELYAKWRDSGIQRGRELLSRDAQSVCLVGLDIQEYYYRIELNWDAFQAQIKRAEPSNPLEALFMERQTLGAKLFNCIREVCRTYREKLNPALAVTHPDLPAEATCLPIGLSVSPVIANWYLKEFDQRVLETIRPAYYGRYVDDILMVVPMSKPPDQIDPINNFMEEILVKTALLKRNSKGDRFELTMKPGLFLQKKKCILQYFDAKHSTAGLDRFQRKIEENASNFALLPIDGDESPVAEVAFDLLYDGSVNKFRSVKAIAENRWELASHLAKQTQLHLMTEDPIDRELIEELFRFFKGRNAIEYWNMWERVISFVQIGGDTEEAISFQDSMYKEIIRVRYSPAHNGIEFDISAMLRDTLIKHLDRCAELSVATITPAEPGSSPTASIWRDSNLIRHHLVAIPLLNYTDYEGNLASPSDANGPEINERKAKFTPRYVHFDECLGFVDSGWGNVNSRDSVEKANKLYELFHGATHEDVTSEIISAESII